MKNASRSVAWERIIPKATLLFVSLLAAVPLWGAGLLNTRGGGDSPFLLLRTHQLAANLRAGVLPARWMPDAAYGFGYPFFSYYAALPYYVAASLKLVGLDILTAIKLTQTLFLAAAALCMYQWSQRVLHTRAGAWLAAVAYAAAPFHLVNLYVRGDSLSEFAAFAFYPLILWGFDRLTSQPSLRRVLLPALAYAGLIVTHNASALIFSPFILLYATLRVVQTAAHRLETSSRSLGRHSVILLLPLLIGLLLSAWFWLPALAETRYVQLDAQTSGYFFYGNHFRGTDLVQRSLLFDYATGQEKVSPFAMGLAQAILALAGALLVSLKGLRSLALVPDIPSKAVGATQDPGGMTLGFGLLGLLISTWLMTPLSQMVWDHLPLLPMVQFPWRFLSIQALFAALLIGAAVPHLGIQGRGLVWLVTLVLGGLLLATALMGLRPDYLSISADDVTPERLQLYELFSGNIGSTIRYEYLPRGVKPRPYTGPRLFSPHTPPRAMPISGATIRAERRIREPTRQVWDVEAGGEGARVAFPLYYWPGWYALIDGTRVAVEAAAGSGYLSLSIPAGSHTVDIRLGRTPLRLGAEITSLIAALTALALYILSRGLPGGDGGDGDEQDEKRRTKKPEPRRGTSRTRYPYAALTYLPFVVLVALLMVFQPRVTAGDQHDLTMDFEEMPYLHHNPGGVSFDGWRMTSYSYESAASPTSQRIAPGATLRVAVDWVARQDHSLVASTEAQTWLRLISPAAIRHDGLPAMAEAPLVPDVEQATPGLTGTVVTSLVIPEETPPGIYLLQVTDGSPVYLRPIWIDRGQDAPEASARATFAGGALRLHTIEVTQSASSRLDVQLGWSAVGHVAANYGLSLSLIDRAGNEWLHQGERSGYNTQPGHGFLPTSLWPLHDLIHDHHVPAVQPGAPPGETYTLTVELYDVATWESVGKHTATVALTQATSQPDAATKVAQFGEELVLSQLEMPRDVSQGEELKIRAHWSTLKSPSADYAVEWHLTGLTRTITKTRPMAPGSSPTEWSDGVWITGRTALPIPPTTPPGSYTLSLKLKEPKEGTTIGSYTHPASLQIEKQDRVWKLPPMDHNVGARFGDVIELAGYDLVEGRESLSLTLYWQALATPDQHYMLFVHLADPQTGEPVAQVDTMPRGFTYPTGRWASGEVVTDEIELSTRDVPAGRYDLAVGWYDPESKQRLEAVNAEEAPLQDDRLLLTRSVEVP